MRPSIQVATPSPVSAVTSVPSRRASTRHPAEEDASRVLLIERVFDAPRELVFDVWTDPAHAAKWWCPAEYQLTALEMDARPGGKWRRCMHAADGTDYWRTGVYREVVRPERLVFTYVSDDPAGRRGHETVVTVTFEDHPRGTRLTFRQELFESQATRDSHSGGWNSTFDRIAEHLAGLQAQR